MVKKITSIILTSGGTPFILLQKLMVDHILKTLIPIAFALKLTAFGILMEILKIFRRSPADSDCIFFSGYTICSRPNILSLMSKKNFTQKYCIVD
jgi:hypothetical protein